MMNASYLAKLKALPMYPNIQFKIDLSETIKNYTLESIYFNFKAFDDLTVEIRLEDKKSSCFRPLLENRNRQRGAKIMSPKDGHNVEYVVGIHQTRNVEEDKSVGCRNYPTKNFKTYEECDKMFILESLEQSGWKNLTPIWGTDQIKDVTNGVLQDNNDIWLHYYLFEGIKPNKCPKPCIKTFADTTFVAATPGMELYGEEWNALLIIFSEDITLTTTTMLEFNFLTCLTYLGADLGLWLGMGAFQLVQVFAGFTNRWNNRRFSTTTSFEQQQPKTIVCSGHQ